MVHSNQQAEELNIRLSKYEKRIVEFEEQTQKHNDLHERMKTRLKQMTVEAEEKNEIVNFEKCNLFISLFYFIISFVCMPHKASKNAN